MHALIAYLDKGIKVYARTASVRALKEIMEKRIARTPKHTCPAFYIISNKELEKLLSKQNKEQEAARQARIKKGAMRAAKTRAENKKAGKKPNFILCPTCDGKSKLLRSEMGGLQTRECKKGHLFEVDMFFGWESNKRRIEQYDRPFFSPTGGNYNDWVQGKFKNDPTGKGQR